MISVLCGTLLLLLANSPPEHSTHRDKYTPGSVPTDPGVYLSCFCLSFWFDPDTAFVHQVNLLLNDLLMVFSVFHGLTIQVEILGVDRLLINDLVEFGA